MSIFITPIPSTIELAAPAFTLGTTNTAGAAVTAVASNSTLLTFDASTPAAVAASAAVGSATVASRRDHAHVGVATITSVDETIARFTGTAGALQGYTSNDPVITDAGILTLAGQPCVLAYPTSNVETATGAGTNYTIALASEVFDQGGNFSSPTFTAPVDGRYLVIIYIQMGALSAAMTRADLTIVTSNRTYGGQEVNIGAIRDPNNTAAMTLSAVCDMDADDALSTAIKVSNGASDAVTVHGTSTVSAYLSIAKVA